MATIQEAFDLQANVNIRLTDEIDSIRNRLAELEDKANKKKSRKAKTINVSNVGLD